MFDLTNPIFTDGDKAREHAIQLKMAKAAVRGELRPADDFSVSDEEVAASELYRKTFVRAYMRKNEKQLGDDEYKALTTGSDPDGGYMVPPAMSTYQTSPEVFWNTMSK